MKRLKELQNLNGQIALVTGGAGHLGTAITEALAELGATVIIASRDAEKCKSLANKIEKEHKVRARGQGCDITSNDSLNELMSFIKQNYGKLDILINNAWTG